MNSANTVPQLMVALDVPSREETLALARTLAGTAPWCKVGMEMFTHAGPPLLEELAALGYNIFLDLKFYDIPHTVAQAVKAASGVGVNMLTLHCQGGERMCRAAREAVASLPGKGPLLFGVTVLTSFAQGEMPGISVGLSDFARTLAANAQSWGLDGVVCSGHEVVDIKSACPSLMCLCPGIRPSGSVADDQRRVMTPAQAVAAGADYLVVGRPIIAAPDPLLAAEQILADMASAT
ncbi:MAG: Orotidine 5'-phosphate decarboxylase [Desulfovibrio sp.]